MTSTDEKSYHISKLGAFSRGIRTDLDGYVHLTAEDWLAAPMDWGTEWDGADEDDQLERCEELAAEARAATVAAEKGIDEWRAN